LLDQDGNGLAVYLAWLETGAFEPTPNDPIEPSISQLQEFDRARHNFAHCIDDEPRSRKGRDTPKVKRYLRMADFEQARRYLIACIGNGLAQGAKGVEAARERIGDELKAVFSHPDTAFLDTEPACLSGLLRERRSDHAE
jgi:hypothetical protein